MYANLLISDYPGPDREWLPMAQKQGSRAKWGARQRWAEISALKKVALPHFFYPFDRVATHYLASKFATIVRSVSQTSGKKESRVRQTGDNPESLTRRFS